ncbi:MAG: TonB-dependent receptor, partial [Sediminibacterium sp.]|nr:TonB-dependent receptor [Sediminibacterium sp.]
NNLNLSWGFSTKSTQLRLSASYDNIEGIVKNSDLERITLRANLNQKIYKDIVKLDIQANASNVANQYPPISNNAGYQGSLIGAAISYNPTFPVFNPDGTYFDNKDGNRNPAAMLEYFKAKDNQNAYLLNGSLTVQPITGLFIKGTVGLENRSTDYRGFADPRVPSSQSNALSVLGKNYDNSGVTGNGRAINQISTINNLLTELTVSYTKTWKSGTLDLLGGISQQQYDNFGRTKIYWGTNNPNGIAYNFSDYANSTPYFAYLNDSATYALQSQFFRANYNLLDRYFFTFTIRRDGSSKFPTNNQFGNFPAFAFKWKILNENWAKPAQKVLDYLDIRVQWGVTGNQEFPPYAQLALRQLNFVGGNSPFTSANPDLKWEQTVSTGVGVDFSFIDGRIKGSVDYFNRNTQDLLLLITYAQPAASNDRWVNLPGNVINEGYDWNLDFEIFRPKTRRNFGWTLSLNGIHLRNEVTNFGSTQIVTGEVSGQGLTGAYAQKILNGYALYSWSMPTFLRFDGNGNAVYADGAADKIQGNPIPAFTGGLTTTFTLNGFRLSLLFNTQQDFYIYNNTANALFLKGSLKTAHNVTREVVNSIENPINPGSVSSRFLERGDFVRLQNVSFSYDFRMKPKQAVKTLSVALIGQNLALWTNYSGLDPEVNVNKSIGGVPSRGFDYTGFPRARTFSLQVNIGF